MIITKNFVRVKNFLKVVKLPPPLRGGWVGLFFIFYSFSLYSQSSTRGNELAVETNKEIAAKHKVMLIPFEPRLFMCEIGKNIAKETNMSFDQITQTFRSGLEFSLLTQVKPTFSTISLLADSSLSYKDLSYIYESTGYSYDIIPDSVVKKNGSKNKVKEDVKKPAIQNGQIMVEANEDQRFMNTKISNKELLTYLNKKYETDIFLFVNQLDIKNVPAITFDINSNGFDREITIHYTVLDKTGNTLNCGVSTSRFSSQLNDPKKIIANNISAATKSISDRLVLTLIPPKAENEKSNQKKLLAPDKVK